MSNHPDNPFWDFSLAVYGRPGVAEACLELQDRHGLDVNLLLLCCWSGSQRTGLESGQVLTLMAAVGDWQRSVIQPLRNVRRWMKDLPPLAEGRLEALRRRVKDCELDAERIEQDMLYEAYVRVGPKPSPDADWAACAAANLIAYLEAVGLAAAPADRACLVAILRGAFDGLSAATAGRLVDA